MRKHAHIAADIGEREQLRSRHGAAGAQMPFFGVQPHRAAAGKHFGRLIEPRALVELRKGGVHQFIDFGGAENWFEIVVGGHAASSSRLPLWRQPHASCNSCCRRLGYWTKRYRGLSSRIYASRIAQEPGRKTWPRSSPSSRTHQPRRKGLFWLRWTRASCG